MKRGGGWHNESQRHRMAGMGYKTTDKFNARGNNELKETRRLPQDIMSIARQELLDNHFVEHDIIISAQGTVVGSQTQIDRHFDINNQNEDKKWRCELGQTNTIYELQSGRNWW